MLGIARHRHRDRGPECTLRGSAPGWSPGRSFSHDLSSVREWDGPAGCPGHALLREEIVDEVVGRVLHHLDFLEDDRLLPLDVAGVEARMQEDVGEEVGGERQMLVEHPHVEAGVLLGGERVHLAAHGVDGARDVLRRPCLRALEDEMLDQVGDPPPLERLHSRARLHPDAHGHRADMGSDSVTTRMPFGSTVLAVGVTARPPRCHSAARHGIRRRRCVGAIVSFSSLGEGRLVAQSLLAREPDLAVAVDLDDLDENLVTLASARPPPPRIRASAIWEMCRSPSVPGMISTKAPNSLMLLTLPR